jgi:hypothetical protein
MADFQANGGAAIITATRRRHGNGGARMQPRRHAPQAAPATPAVPAARRLTAGATGRVEIQPAAVFPACRPQPHCGTQAQFGPQLQRAGADCGAHPHWQPAPEQLRQVQEDEDWLAKRLKKFMLGSLK